MDHNPINAVFLNLDILTYIFKYLDKESKGRAAQVSQMWREVANQKSIWTNVEMKLSSKYCNLTTFNSTLDRDIKRFYLLGFEADTHEFLRRVPNLQSLQVKDDCFNSHFCFFLANFPVPLKELNLSYCKNVSDKLLEFIVQHLPSLEELNLTGCDHVTSAGLRTLSSGLKKLRILYLNVREFYSSELSCISTSMSNEYISNLTRSHSKEESCLVSLEHLHLRLNFTLTDNALKDICHCFVNLVYLDLGACYEISDKGLGYLPLLKKLKSLSLGSCDKITDTGMKSLIPLTNLNHLDLSDSNRITDVGFQYVAQLMLLKRLNLSFCNGVTDKTLKSLARLKSLRILLLQGCIITDKGLSYLADGELKLTELDLSLCQNISESGLVQLCRSSFTLTLLDLHLCFCRIDDTVVNQLQKQFRNLHTLNVGQDQKLRMNILDMSNNVFQKIEMPCHIVTGMKGFKLVKVQNFTSLVEGPQTEVDRNLNFIM